jgi:hypothetical protein
MARSQSYDDQDPREEQAGEVFEIAAEEAVDAPEDMTLDALEALDAEEQVALPTQGDLESQGFTPDQVRRLVVVSDRAAESAESRAAEAELRRLRFTRWLIAHGVLDEWSA